MVGADGRSVHRPWWWTGRIPKLRYTPGRSGTDHVNVVRSVDTTWAGAKPNESRPLDPQEVAVTHFCTSRRGVPGMWPCMTCTETHVVLSRAYRVVPVTGPRPNRSTRMILDCPALGFRRRIYSPVPAACGPSKLTSILAGQRAAQPGFVLCHNASRAHPHELYLCLARGRL
jgi:hypothetical protein